MVLNRLLVLICFATMSIARASPPSFSESLGSIKLPDMILGFYQLLPKVDPLLRSP